MSADNDLSLNALAYTSIQNNVTGDELTSLLNGLKAAPSGQSYQEYLNSILNNTTIKRACCLNKGRMGSTATEFNVAVRIPIPSNFDWTSVPADKAAMYKKFGYIDKTVTIPASVCDKLAPNHDYNSIACQDFMKTYCTNMKYFYERDVGADNYSDVEFSSYKPECSCYNRRPEYVADGIAEICYAPNCDPGNSGVFLDTNSRNGCPATFCNSITNLSGLEAGGSVQLNTKVLQKCSGAGGTTTTNNTTAPGAGAGAGAGAGTGTGTGTNAGTTNNTTPSTNTNTTSTTNNTASNTGSTTNNTTPSNTTPPINASDSSVTNTTTNNTNVANNTNDTSFATSVENAFDSLFSDDDGNGDANNNDTSTTTATATADSDSGLSKEAIIGISVGAIVGGLIIVGIFAWAFSSSSDEKKSHKKHKKHKSH